MEGHKLLPYEEAILGGLYKQQIYLFSSREKNLSSQADYMQFKDALEKMEPEMDKNGKAKVMLDLGSNVYTEATVGKANKVIVLLGKHIYAEMEISEAKSFTARKLTALKVEENQLSSDLASAKSAYKLLLGLKSVATYAATYS